MCEVVEHLASDVWDLSSNATGSLTWFCLLTSFYHKLKIFCCFEASALFVLFKNKKIIRRTNFVLDMHYLNPEKAAKFCRNPLKLISGIGENPFQIFHMIQLSNLFTSHEELLETKLSWGRHSKGRILTSPSVAPELMVSIPKNFSPDVAEIY